MYSAILPPWMVYHRYAHMVVTAVGQYSRWGKTKAKLAAETVGKNAKCMYVWCNNSSCC